MQKAHVFPMLVTADNAVPYSMLVHDYTELKLPQDGLTFLDVQNQHDVLTFNANLLSGFDTVLNDIDFVRKNIDQFRNADGSAVDDQMLAKARKDCLQQMDAIRLQMSQCSNDALVCARIQGAPEDVRKLLPRIGDSNRMTVPNLVDLDISTIQKVEMVSYPIIGLMPKYQLDFGVPHVDTPFVLVGEFGSFSYTVDLASEDIHPVEFIGIGGVFVKEQDPPGGSVVPKGAHVKLKLRTGPPR